MIRNACNRSLRVATQLRVAEKGVISSRMKAQAEMSTETKHPYLRHRPLMNLHMNRASTMATNYIAPNASIIGDVFMSDHSCVYYGTVIRGDKNSVKISGYVYIGDKVVINTVRHVDTGFSSAVEIGGWCIIEPGAVLTSCIIGQRSVIGAGAVVCEGSVLEEGAQLAPGTVVPPSRMVPSNQLWAGNPAKFVREVTPDEVLAVKAEAEERYEMGDMHADEFNPFGQAYRNLPE